MTASDLGAPATAAPARAFSRAGVVSALGAFVLIGGLQAAYGPAVPAFQERFALSTSAAGLALSAHFVGGVAGVLLAHRRLGAGRDRTVLGVCYALMAAGAALFALSPSWPLALAGAVLAGLGFGGVDYGLNHLFAIGFGNRGTLMLNLLNAFFGVGSIVAPVVVGAVGGDRYPVLFGGFAVLAVVLFAGLHGVRTDALSAPDRDDPAAAGRARTAALLGPILAFVALYALNVGIESAVGGWETTHLIGVGWAAGAAATATAGYWLMMTVGRFAVLPLTVRWRPSRIVLTGVAGMAVCLGLATVPGLAPYAYAGVGLFIAPIFPTGLAWLYDLAPGARRAGPYVVAASMGGSVLLPPLLGTGIDLTSVLVVPIGLFVANAVCLALVGNLIRLGRAAPAHETRTTDRPEHDTRHEGARS